MALVDNLRIMGDALVLLNPIRNPAMHPENEISIQDGDDQKAPNTGLEIQNDPPEMDAQLKKEQ